MLIAALECKKLSALSAQRNELEQAIAMLSADAAERHRAAGGPFLGLLDSVVALDTVRAIRLEACVSAAFSVDVSTGREVLALRLHPRQRWRAGAEVAGRSDRKLYS